MTILEIIEEVKLLATAAKDILLYTAGGKIDGDGSGDPHNDPDFQARTSYRNPDPVTGKPRWLNADIVPYVVLPPQAIQDVPGIVLGSWVEVLNLTTGLSCIAVVGDIGPHVKIGEMSIACARAIGVPSSPTTGGDDLHEIVYLVRVGTPAVVNNIVYALQEYQEAA